MAHLKEILPPKHPMANHTPCILLVDASLSTEGKPNEELNAGLVDFGTVLKADTEAKGTVDVCVMSFSGDVRTEVGFRPAEDYTAPVITAGGTTAFNEGLNRALDELEARKAEYRQLNTSYYRPWLFVLTDGYPTDDHLTEETRARMQSYIAGNKVNYIPMAIGAADTKFLASYYPANWEKKPVLRPVGAEFKSAFVWVSGSLVKTSRADPSASTVQSTALPETLTFSL